MNARVKNTELRSLRPKTMFEVIGLEHLYRNLSLISANDSCAHIKGEILDGTQWKPLINHYFSPRTEVRKL